MATLSARLTACSKEGAGFNIFTIQEKDEGRSHESEEYIKLSATKALNNKESVQWYTR